MLSSEVRVGLIPLTNIPILASVAILGCQVSRVRYKPPGEGIPPGRGPNGLEGGGSAG